MKNEELRMKNEELGMKNEEIGLVMDASYRAVRSQVLVFDSSKVLDPKG